MAPSAQPPILPKPEALKTDSTRVENTGASLPAVLCQLCFHPGCDRCCPASDKVVITSCPACKGSDKKITLQLLAMTFEEIDFAKQQAARTNTDPNKKGRKRKSATIARLTGSMNDSAEELRTGRWTGEETAYCDALILLFEHGKLPIPNGLKLNEFLANMLKSKQSRLTKKMKNARLSTRQYQRQSGHISDAEEAASFSRLEAQFFASITCPMERAEVRFHMQKEWRDHFSNYCVLVKQPLDANAWLSSVEELDRRASLQKENERMVRRKVMMGHALHCDATNCHLRGVYIEGSQEQHREPVNVTKEDHNAMEHYASPFITKVLSIMKHHRLPFEHVDAWVPSFVQPGNSVNSNTPCRLCFAGCGTTKQKIQPGGGDFCKMNKDEEFHLRSFGEYSQKFSFDIGSGLPGRVYSSGIASWEQGIQNAPLGKFERRGGASQWGIQTVLGIPIPSPSVGRIVIIFYSVHDRIRQLDLVQSIAEDLNKLRPSPKWKLVVDIGQDAIDGDDDMDLVKLNSLLRIIEANTPKDSSSPLVSLLPGFTSLRLLLVKENRSRSENELVRSVLVCYDSYVSANRFEADIACMTARDFMGLSKDSSHQMKTQFPDSASSQGNVIGPHLSSGKGQPTAFATTQGSDYDRKTAVQYYGSSNGQLPQSLVSQLNESQPVNDGLSALGMAISLAKNGINLSASRETMIISTDGSQSQRGPATIGASANMLVGTSPALNPISSDDNTALVPISGHLADLVHLDGEVCSNSIQQDGDRAKFKT